MWTSISITLGAVLLIILGVWGAYAMGKKHGKSEIRQADAEARARDLIHGAGIAARPHVDRPLGRMRPR